MKTVVKQSDDKKKNMKNKFKIGDKVMWRVNVVNKQSDLEERLFNIRHEIDTLEKNLSQLEINENEVSLPSKWDIVYDPKTQKYYHWNNQASMWDPSKLHYLKEIMNKMEELFNTLEKKEYIPDEPNQIRYGEIISIEENIETPHYIIKRTEEPTREETGQLRRSKRIQNKVTGKKYNSLEMHKENETILNMIFDRAEKEQGFETLTSYSGYRQIEPDAVQYRSSMPPLPGEGYNNQTDEKVGLMDEKNLLSIRDIGKNQSVIKK